jgi:hypothetical protein
MLDSSFVVWLSVELTETFDTLFVVFKVVDPSVLSSWFVSSSLVFGPSARIWATNFYWSQRSRKKEIESRRTDRLVDGFTWIRCSFWSEKYSEYVGSIFFCSIPTFPPARRLVILFTSTEFPSSIPFAVHRVRIDLCSLPLVWHAPLTSWFDLSLFYPRCSLF